MQSKIIDSKLKEIYYTAQPIKEEAEVLESRFNFWNTMNIVAMQNMSYQQMKMN